MDRRQLHLGILTRSLKHMISSGVKQSGIVGVILFDFILRNFSHLSIVILSLINCAGDNGCLIEFFDLLLSIRVLGLFWLTLLSFSLKINHVLWIMSNFILKLFIGEMLLHKDPQKLQIFDNLDYIHLTFQLL